MLVLTLLFLLSTDVFLPCPDSLLVTLKDSKEVSRHTSEKTYNIQLAEFNALLEPAVLYFNLILLFLRGQTKAEAVSRTGQIKYSPASSNSMKH